MKREKDPWADSEAAPAPAPAATGASADSGINRCWERETVGGVEPTPDDSGRHVWPTFQAAHKHYGFPGSHQVGSWGDACGVLRTYSNSSIGKDLVPERCGGAEIWYRLKDDAVKAKFLLNIGSGQRLHFFRKVALPLPLSTETETETGVGVENSGDNGSGSDAAVKEEEVEKRKRKRKRSSRQFGCKEMGLFRVAGFGVCAHVPGSTPPPSAVLGQQNTHGRGRDTHVRLLQDDLEGDQEQEQERK